MTETTIQAIESQSSAEIGSANKRLKIYFWNAEELKRKLTEIEAVLIEKAQFISRLNEK